MVLPLVIPVPRRMARTGLRGPGAAMHGGYPAYVRITDGTPSASVGGRRTETADLRSVVRSRARVDART
jgi:hypothetical protein